MHFSLVCCRGTRTFRTPPRTRREERVVMPLPASLRRRDPGVSGTESLDGHRREVHAKRRRTDREGSRPHKVPSRYPAYVAPLPIERGLSVPQSSRSATSLTRALSPHRKTPTQFAAAARSRTPHRTRRGERVDMPLPTSLKFALLLQPRPCRLRHALTFRQGWSSLQRRGSGTAAPRQGPPSSAESAPREKTPRPRPPNRNPPPTVCVHHFTPWNRCESEPLPTQSQTFHSSLTVFRVVANSFFRVAPASSNGPHPDRRPHNASDITLSYSAYAVSYAPVEASRGPHRFHPRGSPPLSRRRGRHFGNRPYLLERTPRVSSESPGDRTRTPYYFMVVSVAYGQARKGQSRDSML